jgi:addiction module HigA family antidote
MIERLRALGVTEETLLRRSRRFAIPRAITRRNEPIESFPRSAAQAPALERRRATLARKANLLNARASLTPEMALRIEKAFGPKMEHLMKMQLAYDIARTRARASRIRVRPYEQTT